MAELAMSNEDGLTEEERAALNEDIGDENVTENGNADDTGTDDNADDVSTNDNDTDPETNDESPSRDDGTDPDAGSVEVDPLAGSQEQGQPDASQQQAAAIIEVEGVAEAQALLAELPAKKETLLQQFDDGDITAREYQAQLDQINKDERRAELTVHDAEMEARRKETALQQEWGKTVNNFFNENQAYKENGRLYRALDAEVREIAATPEGASMTGLDILKKAHANLVEAGFVQAAPKQRRSNQNGKEIPPNLAKVPASETSETSDGKYAALDRLANTDPLAYEERLAAMPDKERDAYLANG